MKRLSLAFALMLLATTVLTVPSQAQNPCNPSAKKKGTNPCNPCAKKKGQNPCNPCAKKKGTNPCNPCAKKAMNPCTAKFTTSGKESTVVGYIGDSQCGLQHPMKMGDAKECTLKCIEMGGHFILADPGKKVVYLLDKEAQTKAKEFAGQKVKVTGHVSNKDKTIHVTKIEVAS